MRKQITDNKIIEKLYVRKYNEGSIIRNIKIKSSSIPDYQEKIKKGYIPYQSIDMQSSGNVRFTTPDDYSTFMKNKTEFLNSVGQTPLEFPSDVDIHKMKRSDPNYNYKYLIQIDPNVKSLLNQINQIITKNIVTENTFTFIPNLLNFVEPINAEQHNVYDKIQIVNNKQFIEKLKGLIPQNKLGEVIYKLNTLFQTYNNFFEILNRYGINLETTTDSIRDIVMAENKRISGLNKERIAKRLFERNQDMMKVSQSPQTNCDIDALYKNYFDQLTKKDKIEEIKSARDEIELCNARSIMLKSLINPYLAKPTSQEDFNKYYDQCMISKFAHIDTISNPLQRFFCDDILNQITDPNKKDQIKQTLKPYTSDKPQNKRCIFPYDDTIQKPPINLDEYYMPEWYNNICDSNVKEAHNHRQLILGKFGITNYLKFCSMIFRSDPFIDQDCDLPFIHHDIEINKLVVSCLAGSNDIFPIRIINANEIENMDIYESYQKDESDILLGSLAIKLKGQRFGEERYYILYIYLKENNDIVLVNFRNNKIIPGTVFDHMRILYLELNTLMYFNDDVKAHPLHYYKRLHNDKNGYDVYVSRYDKNTIKNKYDQMKHMKEYSDKINNLIETQMIKNINKQIIFKDIMVGGNNKVKPHKFYSFDFKCYDYKWDVQTDNKSLLFDQDIFSLSLLKKQINLSFEYSNLAGIDVYKLSCIPMDYFIGIFFHDIGSIEGRNVITQLKKETVNNKKALDRFKLLKPNEGLLAYGFESTPSYTIYTLLNEILKPKPNTKYVIFSKNHYALDGIVYYHKYKALKYNPNNFTFFAYEVENNMFDQAEKYLKTIKIDPISIRSIMNNNWISQSSKFINNVDIALIDIVINIKPMHMIRYPYLLQSQLPTIILSLQKLNRKGTMILNTCLIPNKMVFNFITYLSCSFNKTYIHELVDTDMHEVANISLSWVVFEGYKGDIDMDKLLDLNKLFCDLDPSGGYEFDISDKELKKELNIKSNINQAMITRKYITNIIDINDSQIKTKYEEYKEYVKMKLLGSIRNFSHYLDLYINRNNKKYIDDKCTISKLQAVEYAKKYDLPLVDWINEIPEQYFNDIITNKLKDIDFTFIEKLPQTTNLTIKPNNLDQDVSLFNNLAVSESAYQYIEKINYNAYKNIELVINSRQKLLNKKLQEDNHININGKYVSRAWIKFFELLTDTQLLKPYKDHVKVFHMCEAPGNFINSMDYFIKTKTKIKAYDWNAQSLEGYLADFYDTYQFIKKTKDKWDLGPKKTGDILDPINQKYYINQYKDSDVLISDCGEKWTGEEIPDHENLAIYQLYYALFIPKVGGSFVIKTFAANDNKLYLSLLTIICEKYEKVSVFKSNTNFWSPEVYIVGQNKKEITAKELNVLTECLDNLNQKSENKYPITKIPEKFLDEYNKIMYQVISFASNIKKFFVFLSLNKELFNKNKDNINKILDKKNDEWIKRYIK